MSKPEPEQPDDVSQALAEFPSPPPGAVRRKLPESRDSITRHFRIPDMDPIGRPVYLDLYITAGMYPDGTIGEVFIKADKVGSLASGAFEAVAMMISIGLQHGVPLDGFTSKLRNTRFGPNGFTGDSEFHSCTSPLDLVARWLDARFGPKETDHAQDSGNG